MCVCVCVCMGERLSGLPNSSSGEFLPLPVLCPLTSEASKESGG